MTSNEPNVSDTGRYSITETSRILEVSSETIRRHTKGGMINCKFSKVNGRRFYTGTEIKKYWRLTF